MRQKQDDRGAVEKAVREIKRRTRRRFSPANSTGNWALICSGEVQNRGAANAVD